VRVLEVRGRNVRLGVRFPPEATVLREEVFAQVRQENEAAALSTPQDLARVAELGLSIEMQETEPT
jgi:carbon storage regulator